MKLLIVTLHNIFCYIMDHQNISIKLHEDFISGERIENFLFCCLEDKQNCCPKSSTLLKEHV